MTARTETNALQHRIFARTGVSLSFDDANTLRRAEIALRRWGELECGNSDQWRSWMIERDEKTGIPHMVTHRTFRIDGEFKTTITRRRIPDREAGALRRVADVCQRNGLHFYHQGDPRGCALYVSNEPMPDHNYTRGVACCGEG